LISFGGALSALIVPALKRVASCLLCTQDVLLFTWSTIPYQRRYLSRCCGPRILEHFQRDCWNGHPTFDSH